MAGATIIGQVAVKVVPDTDEFRSETERALSAIEKAIRNVEIRFKADVKDAAKEATKAIQAAQKAADAQKVKLRFDPEDSGEIERELRRVDEMIKDLGRVDLAVEVDDEALKRARLELEDKLIIRQRIENEIDNAAYAKIKDQINRALEGVQVDPELDPLKARGLKNKLEKLFEQADGVRAQIKPELSEREKRRLEREIEGIEAEISVTLGELSVKEAQARLILLARRRIAEIVPVVNKAAAAKAAAALAALSGGRALKNTVTDLSDWISGLDKAAPKITAVSTGVLNLGSYLLAASSNALTFGSSLASIGGAGLALPGIFGGMAIGIGASIAVLKDFNEVIPEFQDRLSALQNTMSDNFWQEAEAPFRSFISSIFPLFREGMNETSTALGQWFGGLADGFENVLNGPMQGMFDDLAESIQISSQYTQTFANIITRLGQVGAGNLPKLAKWFGDITVDFDNWLAAKGPDGLQEFIDVGIDALQDLGSVVADTGRTFAGLARAAEAAGGSTLSIMADTMEGVAGIVNSSNFQKRLTAVFAGAHDAMSEISTRSGPAFESLMIRVASLLSTLLPQAGEAAGIALEAVFSGLDQKGVQDNITRFGDSVIRVMQNLAPAMRPTMLALSAIIETVGDLAENFSAALGPALETIAPAITDLTSDLDPLIKQLGDLLANAASGAAPVVVDLAGALGQVAQSLATILQPLNSFLDLMGKLPAPVQGALSKLTAVGLLIGGAIWFGLAARAKITQFGLAMTQMAAQSTVAQGALLRTGAMAQATTARMSGLNLGIAGAGLAVGTLGSQAAGSNEKLSILAQAGGGAMMGFAVGGPYGAAIGAGAGALFGLATQALNTKDALEETGDGAIQMADTIDQLTGAATEGTRRLALQAIQNTEGASDAAQTLGVSYRQLVNAALNPTSQSAKQLDQMLYGLTTTLVKARGSTKGATDQQELMGTSAGKLTGILREVRKEWGATTNAWRNDQAVVGDVARLLQNFPEKVITRIDAKGFPETTKAVARLAAQFKLTPKEIRTLIKFAGEEVVMRDVKRVRNELVRTGKVKVHPSVQVDTKDAKNDAKDIRVDVQDIDQLEGVAGVRIKDEATVPVGKVQKLLNVVAKTTVKATVGIVDNATQQINAIRTNLATLNGNTATVTTYHRSVHTSTGGANRGPAEETGANRVVPELERTSAMAAKAGARVAQVWTDEFLRELEAKMKRIASAGKVLNKAFSWIKGHMAQLAKKIGRDDIPKWMKRLSGNIEVAVKNFAKMQKQLVTLKDKFKQVREEMKAYRQSIVDNIVAMGDVTGAGEELSFEDILRQMTGAAGNADAFADVIEQLIAAGLNDDTLQQLIAAGPEAALAQAQAILAAGGAGVAQINDLAEQIRNAGQDLADAAAQHFYEDQLNQLADQIENMLTRLNAMKARIREWAKDLIRALVRQLKAEMPKVMRQLDRLVPNKPGNNRSELNRANTSLALSRTHLGRKPQSATADRGRTNVLNYYASDGPSITSEERLFRAAKRGRLAFN